MVLGYNILEKHNQKEKIIYNRISKENINSPFLFYHYFGVKNQNRSIQQGFHTLVKTMLDGIGESSLTTVHTLRKIQSK